MPNPSDIFQEWRTADRRAHALEMALTQMATRAMDSRAALPTQEERDQARKLRALADDLFHLAMDEMKERAAKYRAP